MTNPTAHLTPGTDIFLSTVTSDSPVAVLTPAVVVDNDPDVGLRDSLGNLFAPGQLSFTDESFTTVTIVTFEHPVQAAVFACDQLSMLSSRMKAAQRKGDEVRMAALAHDQNVLVQNLTQLVPLALNAGLDADQLGTLTASLRHIGLDLVARPAN